MKPELFVGLGPVDNGYFPHLRECGFSTSLSISPRSDDGGELCLRMALSHILKEMQGEDRRWSFSFVGASEEGAILTVLGLLAENWPQVTLRVTEILKEYEERAMPYSEIAFTAPHALLEEMLLRRKLRFGFNLKLCGWLLKRSVPPEEALALKLDSQGRFTIPDPNLELAFATSDDWDAVEFFSSRIGNLEKVGTLSRQLS
jgi:hypothetical protein